MEIDKQPRTAKPESLEAKFKLLALLPYDRRAKRKHSLVFGFILDWFHSKYGDALASVRHVAATIKERDPTGEGMGIRHVQDALSDLVAWGYLEQEKGVGRRASRYVPVWAKLSSVSPVGIHNENEISVSPVGYTSVSHVGNTTPASVSPVGNEDPSTGPGHRTGERKDGIDCDAATPPPVVGLEGRHGAEAVQGGFDELWSAYAHKRGKAEARRAYAKLAPDTGLHAAMVEAARAWQAAWAAQEKQDAPRFTLAKWLEREEYECAPPAAYRPKERTPKADKTPEPKVDDETHGPSYASNVSRQARIRTADRVRNKDGDQLINLQLELSDGRLVDHVIVLESSDLALQKQGAADLAGLLRAIGRDELGDLDELMGAEVEVVIENDRVASWYALWKPRPSRPPPKFAEIVRRHQMNYRPNSFAAALAHKDDDEKDAA